jgi:hypothetical protein
MCLYLGKFPLRLVHQKSPPQVPKKPCFPCILWKIWTCGGLFWGTNPSGKLALYLMTFNIEHIFQLETAGGHLNICKQGTKESCSDLSKSQRDSIKALQSLDSAFWKHDFRPPGKLLTRSNKTQIEITQAYNYIKQSRECQNTFACRLQS